MNTDVQSIEDQEMSTKQTQLVMTNRQDINLQLAQNIIDWYFSKYALNWSTFLEAKRIALITNDTSFVSKALRIYSGYSLTEAESRCF